MCLTPCSAFAKALEKPRSYHQHTHTRRAKLFDLPSRRRAESLAQAALFVVSADEDSDEVLPDTTHVAPDYTHGGCAFLLHIHSLENS